MIAYRPDIDGLRAVAVLAVVVFHAFPSALSGGFVGVDVFFVISGYLITSILMAEPADRGLMLGRFYERRIRRIFPALFTVVLVTALLGYLVLFPKAADDLGRSTFYGTFFALNVMLYRGVGDVGGYFDRPATDRPLLHIWSLSVEEQFYLLFPIALWLLRRYVPAYRAVLVAVTVLSFGAASWYAFANPPAAFYLPHLRAWELLIGALVALGAVPAVTHKAGREGVALAGLALIGFSCVSYGGQLPFPGALALAPCLGAAAVIHAGASGTSAAGKALSAAPLVAVGLISYSLYLWHWPALYFARLYAIRPLSTAETWGAVALAVGLSVASYFAIEKPARHAKLSRRTVFALAGIATALVAGVGFAFASTDGLPARFRAPERSKFLKAADELTLQPGMCDSPQRDLAPLEAVVCTMGGQGLGEPSIAVWGDSHAISLSPVIKRIAAATSRRALVSMSAGCAPLLDVRRVDELATEHAGGWLARFIPPVSTPKARSPNGLPDCDRINAKVAEIIERTKTVRDVLIVARWSVYAEGQGFRHQRGTPFSLRDAQSREVEPEHNPAVLERGLERTLARLSRGGYRVSIVAQPPEVGWSTPWVLFRISELGSPLAIAPTWQEHLARQRHALPLIERLAQRYGASLLRADRPFCDGARCAVTAADGAPLYSDGNHVSSMGAQRIEPILMKALGER